MDGSGKVRSWGTTEAPDLAAQTEVGDQLGVAVLVGLLEVVQQLAPLVDHLQEATARVVILLVRFEMRREAIDALAQQRDLDFGGAGIGLATAVLLDHNLFLLNIQRHFLQLQRSIFRSFRGRAFYRRAPRSTRKIRGFETSSGGGSGGRRRPVRRCPGGSRRPRSRPPGRAGPAWPPPFG